jgi:putative sporulation protein YtxC
MKIGQSYNKLSFLWEAGYMYYSLSIASAIDYKTFEKNFRGRFAWIQQRGYTLNIVNDNLSESNGLCLSVQGDTPEGVFRDEDVIYIFKHQLSELLAEHILTQWEEKLVWKEILRSYKRCNAEDRKIILKKATELLNHCNNNEHLNLLFNFGRKNKIASRILEYINENNFVIVEGLITFYLPEYLNEIRFAVEMAYEEMRNEKEYNEFVRLLRYFVDTQPPRTFEVNLMIDKDNGFSLWDGSGARIEDSKINGFFDEDILLEQVDLDDVLISILITIAPRWIIIHNSAEITDTESVLMIKEVFQDRFKFCNGCKHCRPQKGNRL